MNLKFLILAIPAAALGILAALSNGAIKAQNQISDPPPLPQTPASSIQIPPLPSATERLNNWSQNNPNQPLPTSISFGKRVPDAQVIQLMERYNVKPRAVFLSVAGLSGTHRSGESLDATRVIAEARQKIVEMMQADLNVSPQRFKDFVEHHPRQQVVDPSAADTQLVLAKSLLESLEKSEVALTKARGNQPLVTGVEVVGTIEDIRRLATDPNVKEFEPAVEFNGEVVVPTPTAESDQLKSSQDVADRVQAIQALQADEVYTRIQSRAQGGNQ